MLSNEAIVSKIYHSREDRISELHDDCERIQYDGQDERRIDESTDAFFEFADKMGEAVEQFLNSEDDRELEVNRCNLIERWALTQAALSKMAWCLRFDGNIAYERMVNALSSGAAADMRGL